MNYHDLYEAQEEVEQNLLEKMRELIIDLERSAAADDEVISAILAWERENCRAL